MGMLLRRRHQAADEATPETTESPSEGSENPEGTSGTEGGSESTESGTEAAGEGTEPTPPTRNASKADWLAFLGLDSDDRSRDELAESVLGPKQ